MPNLPAFSGMSGTLRERKVRAALMHYSFGEIDWKYDLLTPNEQRILTREEFAELERRCKADLSFEEYQEMIK